MTERDAYLVLQDGSIFNGIAFGADRQAIGEVVFSTSMTGYQEMLTDPSFAGQIVVPTYPLIGNYGINDRDNESGKVHVAGFVVRDLCDLPSHSLSTSNLNSFLENYNVPGISGVDTRAVTRRLRNRGVMMGSIVVGSVTKTVKETLLNAPRYGDIDLVSSVSTDRFSVWTKGYRDNQSCGQNHKVVVYDYGVKNNILRMLQMRGCDTISIPAKTPLRDVLGLKPDGLVLSPGPGDPELLDYAVKSVSGLLGRFPILGICLGNQILARAFGGKNYKLKFGHRGGNHPVRNVATGRVHITAQNHGYSVDADSLPAEVEVSHISLNDGTVEGLRHKSIPAMSIQYHSEGSPGPLDNAYDFNLFLKMLKDSLT
jgi:carbamoyl-phosphate synthase small subunit